jgi:hypothetical protein
LLAAQPGIGSGHGGPVPERAGAMILHAAALYERRVTMPQPCLQVIRRALASLPSVLIRAARLAQEWHRQGSAAWPLRSMSAAARRV